MQKSIVTLFFSFCILLMLLVSCSSLQNVKKTSSLSDQSMTADKAYVVDNNALPPAQVLEQKLRKTSGLIVTGSGNNLKVKIRGSRTLYSQEPLYVINESIQTQDFSQVVSALGVGEIKTITVLKDAASTSMYGSRGSNGVILITTK